MEVAEAAERYLRGETKDPEILSLLARGSDESGRDYYLLLNCLRSSDNLWSTPKILKRIIKENRWQKWQWIGREFHAESLTEYLTKHPPRGLGADLPIVERLIADDPEALALFRQYTVGTAGRPRKNGDNITIKPERGTSKAYILQRLKTQRPDLYELVKAGKYSANAAAIKAGWRKKAAPLEILRKTWARASPQERQTFLNEILPHASPR